MLKLHIRFEFGGVYKIKPAALNRIKRAALRHVAEVWHREMRPKHFTEEGAREYAYEKRNAGYMIAKNRAKTAKGPHGERIQLPPPNQRPLVWTGESEKRTENAKISANKNRAIVSMNAPTLNFHPYTVKELTTISTDESSRLADECVGMFNNLLGDYPEMEVKVFY